jgi:serine/threonine-protein kinase HipA
LNGKKKRIKRTDFEYAFTTLKLEAKQQANIFSKMAKVKEKWLAFIQMSFLSEDFKCRYTQLIQDRFARISEV